MACWSCVRCFQHGKQGTHGPTDNSMHVAAQQEEQEVRRPLVAVLLQPVHQMGPTHVGRQARDNAYLFGFWKKALMLAAV